MPQLLIRTLATVAAVAGLGAAFLAGTSAGGAGADRIDRVDDDLARVGAASCEDLLEWYVDQGVERVGPYGWGSPEVLWPIEGPLAEDSGEVLRDLSAADAPAAGPAPVRSTSEASGTNVQEAGVDEPDVVKTDGTTLFRIEDGDLVTYDLTGAAVERLASVDLPWSGRDAAELLLSDETVVVVATDDGGTDEASTDVATYDVADPADPELAHTATYDTDLLVARLHGDVVRLVLDVGLPDLDFDEPGRWTDEREATEHNQDVVRDSDLEDWLPTTTNAEGEEEPLIDCDEVAVPDEETSLGTVAVVGFEAATPGTTSVTALAAGADVAYASTDQLYLASAPKLGWDDGETQLHAYDLSGTDTVLAASGEVDGVVRDRWSVDAADGVLRVAVGPSSATGAGSAVVTFAQDGDDLVESGRVDDLGVGEDLKAVRWFDTLAVLVTFREVDPLYAVDLTDPASPELIGELKIPGFSAYLHPLGERRLLGLGEGPSAGDWGAQAALFDVTDLTDPRQLDVVGFGSGTTALATLDPRQLTWLPDSRTVLSVVADWSGGGATGYVSVLTLGDGELDNAMVEVEHGDEVDQVRLVPLPDGRVVLVTEDDASFFDVA